MFRPAHSHPLTLPPVLLTTASLYARWAGLLRRRASPVDEGLILVLPRANPRVRERLLAIGHSARARGGRIRVVEDGGAKRTITRYDRREDTEHRG